VDSIAGFPNFDLDFLREVLGFGGVAVPYTNLRRNFELVTSAAMNADLAEAMIEAEALASRERESLLEIARDLLLCWTGCESWRACRER
jgi:hypothetical protein